MIKKIIFLIFLFFIPFSIQAKDELSLEIVNECDIQYAGNSCIINLNLINNTDETLDGKATFSILYNEELLENQIGIDVSFGLSNIFSKQENGKIIFSDFDITKGTTSTYLEIETHPALISGVYSFTLSIEGTGEETYITPSQNGGGCGIPYSAPKITPTMPSDIEPTEDLTPVPIITIKELKVKIKEVQNKLIILIRQLILIIYQSIIDLLRQLIII